MSIKSPLNRQFGTQFDSVFDVVKSNPMYDKTGGKIPSLDLNFAKSKSLRDSRSTKNLINFTRASSGTYVDSDGLIKTSPVNKLLYSNTFTNSAWIKNSETLVSSAATAPDGTATATTFTFILSLGYIYQDTSSVIGQSYVTSIWIKGNANATLGLRRPGMNNTTIGSNGSVAINVTTEWQKFTAVTTSADNTDGRLLLDLRQSNGAIVPSGFEVSLWHAQTEEGTTATDYIPTGATIGGAPRFDHDPITGKSLGLLIEESRTNFLTYSNDLSQWNTAAGSAVGSQLLAPDGTNTGSIVTSTGGGVNNTSVSGSGAKVLSAYFKNVASGVTVRFGSTSDLNRVFFDSSYQITGQDSNVLSATFEDSSNGWKKLTIVSSADFNAVLVYATPGSFGVWGVQLEAGTFPTSYIPTSGSTVTRSPDIAMIEGNKFAKTNLIEYSERFDQSAWNIDSGSTVTPNAAESPTGGLTADYIQINAADKLISQSLAVISGLAYTASVYVKGTEGETIRFCGSNITGVSNKTLTGGWDRIRFTGTSSSSSISLLLSTYGGATARNFYLWGAQLEEGDELTEYTPSVESFVSRASSATYVDDATGLIKTTPVNLLTYSEQFDQSDWTKFGSFVSSQVLNAALSPDGTQSAEEYQNLATGNNNVQQPVTTSAQSYIFSIYLKAKTASDVGKSILIGGHTSAAIHLREVVQLPAEWTRFIKTGTPTSAAWNWGVDGRTAGVFTGINVAREESSFYVWGAQLEEGTTASPYIKTTSTISGAARYENGDLLLEPARTNTALGSDVVAGSDLGSTIIQSLENIISPRGVSESVRKFSFGSAGSNVWRVGSTAGGTANTTYAISFWAKTVNGGSTSFNIDINDRNPSEGQSTTIDGEWKRYVKVGGSRNNAFRFFDINVLTATEPIYIWGSQIEAAPYATSYIPTTSSTVTRAADVSTSALGVDSWYNQNESTIFYEASAKSGGIPVALFNSGSFNSLDPRINVNVISGSLGGGGRTQVNNSGIQFGTGNNYTPTYVLGTLVKQASALQSDNFAHCFEGGTVITDNSGTLPSTLSRVSIGANWTPIYINGHISRLAHFPTRLPDDKLKSITT